MSLPQVLLSIVVASIRLYSLTDCESGKLWDFGFKLTLSLLLLCVLLNYFVHLGSVILGVICYHSFIEVPRN